MTRPVKPIGNPVSWTLDAVAGSSRYVDRHAGVPVAVATSIEVTRRNPLQVAAWGLIVAALLVIGSIPFFIGLIFVLPVLGHATWHLYRRAVI